MEASQDTSVTSRTHQFETGSFTSPKYGGFTRFEIELEFVQSLSSPTYLLHLATSNAVDSNPPTPLLQYPPFIAYLSYLQYWTQPSYAKYLMYPGPTLKNLEMLQSERFRREILSPEVVERIGTAALAATDSFFGGNGRKLS